MTLRNKKWAFSKNTKSLLSYFTDQGCTNRGRQFARPTIFYAGAYSFEAAARFLGNLCAFGIYLHICSSTSTVIVGLVACRE